MSSSDFFKACFELDMIESREGIVRIDQEDEKLLTYLIKSLYTDQLSIEDEIDVVPMILLSQKYQLNALIPVLIDHLINTMDGSTVLQCLHLDLEEEQFTLVKHKAQQQFQESSLEILKGKSYLTLNVEQLMSALEMLAFQNNSPPALFDPKYIGRRAKLSDKNKKITKNGENGFSCGALGMKCDSFSVRLIKNCTNLMIGMAPRTINKDGKNCNSCGWYLCCENGCLYSQRGHGKSFYNKPYYNQSINQDGVVVGVSLQDGEVSYSVNDQDLGVAFRGVKGIDLHPAFDVYDSGCEFEFL